MLIFTIIRYYYTAEEAIDTLMDSPWATGKDCIFTDRQSVEDFCHDLLLKEIYHRATLVKRKPKPTKPVITDGNETPAESGTEVIMSCFLHADWLLRF